MTKENKIRGNKTSMKIIRMGDEIQNSEIETKKEF